MRRLARLLKFYLQIVFLLFFQRADNNATGYNARMRKFGPFAIT